MMLQSEVDTLRDSINDHGIYRVPFGSKEMPAMNNAGYYTWQFYLRSTLLCPASLKTICSDFWSRYDRAFTDEPFQIAGVESAAVPIITAIVCSAADRGHSLNAFTIRKNRKEYGRRNLIEGTPNHLPVLFIDDLTSPKHNAFWHAVQAISSHGLRLSGDAYVLVRKQERAVSPLIATSIGTVNVQSIFTLDDFSLELEAYIEEKRRATVLHSDVSERALLA